MTMQNSREWSNALTITFRILMFTLMPAWGLSAAASTLVGQNLGARKLKRATLAVWLTARYNVVFLSVVTVAYLVFAPQIAAIFISSPEVISLISTGLRVIVLGYVFFGLGMVMIQAFNGEATRAPRCSSTLLFFYCLRSPSPFYWPTTWAWACWAFSSPLRFATHCTPWSRFTSSSAGVGRRWRFRAA